MASEEFIRVGTMLYKIVDQPTLNGGYVRKRIAWNNETLRQDYGKDYLAIVPKYDGFCTVPEHVSYQPVIGKFLNLYEPIDHQPITGRVPQYPVIGAAHLRGAIRVGDGLPATALPATRTEVAYPVVGFGGTQHGQKHIPEFSENPISEQCDL